MFNLAGGGGADRNPPRVVLNQAQVVLAAGLAGGVGLCGGACGALGAAIWIMSMRLQEAGSVKNLWTDATFTAEFDGLIDRFLKSKWCQKLGQLVWCNSPFTQNRILTKFSDPCH